MADGHPHGAPQLLQKRLKPEDNGGEAQPKEEATEEPSLPLLPPTVQGRYAVFTASPPKKPTLIKSSVRRRRSAARAKLRREVKNEKFEATTCRVCLRRGNADGLHRLQRGGRPPGGGLGPASRRKREKGGGGSGQDGTSPALYVDRRKSKVWNYYTKLGDAYVECNICKKQLSFHNSTTTMREHLVRKHGIRDTLLSQLKDDQVSESDYAAPENAVKRCRQMTPESGFYHAASCSEPRSEVILELVLEMIFRDLHPLSVVKDKGFGLLLGYLEPNFTLPTPVQLSGMLWHRYNVVKQHLERYLRTAQAIVLCVEFWASQLSQTYLSITANFIDGEWRRARCGMETQAEDDLGEKLYASLAEFGLSGKSVFCVMHDSPQSAAATAPQLKAAYGWTSLCCAARTLHLCIKAGLEVQQVEEALSIARGIVRYFQQDAKATCSLNSKLEAINKTKLKLVMDVGSRWITTIEMCETLLDLKWAIMSVLEEHPKGAAAGQNLADHQWKLLQDLLPVMRTIKIATSFLREEQNASVSSLMPCVHGIVAAIGQQGGEGRAAPTVVGNIRSELRQRWGLAEDEKVLESPAVIASFLDPRFKEMRFLSPSLRSELHQRVKTMLSQACNHHSPSGTQFGVPNSDPKAGGGDAGSQLPAHKDRCSSAPSQSIYDILLGKDPTESMPEIHQQLENYIVEPLCKRSTNPLHWWKNNEHRFPAVARLSRQYLAIPATALLPEQAFATGQSALEHRRAVLAPENLRLCRYPRLGGTSVVKQDRLFGIKIGELMARRLKNQVGLKLEWLCVARATAAREPSGRKLKKGI
ncbi:PREDICTED: zinc finger BED domain-containing protein 1-like [Charadrius vociferus]|uniref:zinc finger BED domain-containing protein 1-like n=1 Tax=Charadrius vociferus TaxID=50402 RepID=UPI0005212F40|nr:PREDICTED: zinc finger BED domain-containing protein 1-like [Charadrius vociferus]